MQYPFPKVIDSSMVNDLKSCEMLFNHKYVAEWKPKGLSVHLHAGKAFAKGLEAARTAYYVQGQSAENSVAEGLRALLLSYGDFQCPADSAKSAARMAGALEFYFDNYPLGSENSEPYTFPSGRRGIEFTFAHPLPINHPTTGEPLIYSGAMDALINFAGGVYICDEKTTSQLGATWSRQWDLRAQFTAYAWGCREAGIKVQGAVVRGVSILKTKYDTQQAITYRPDWMIDCWYNQMLDWVESAMARWHSGSFRHNFGDSCADYGGCEFRRVCSAADPQVWLETDFERRHWDPIAKEETVLE